VTEAQMREAVAASFAAGWALAQPAIPLDLDNEVAPSADAKALLQIQLTTSRQMTQGRNGTRRVQRQVWLAVKLWRPANEGSAALAGLADSARSLLEMVSIPSPVTGDEPVTTLASDGGVSPYTDGRWWMQVVRVPGWYAETK
jgi:hypothetical protein